MSEEGSTQGDNCAMPFYGIASAPMIKEPGEILMSVKPGMLTTEMAVEDLLNYSNGGTGFAKKAQNMDTLPMLERQF